MRTFQNIWLSDKPYPPFAIPTAMESTVKDQVKRKAIFFPNIF